VSLVLRALPLSGALGGAAVPEARAQSAGCNELTADIPPQPLEQALSAFARQTGCSLVYVSQVLRNQRSSAVSSGLTADAALTRLLAGTGLRFEHLTANGIRILAGAPHSPVPPAVEVPEIIVTATRREESLEDVPMTVQTLSGEQARQLGVTTFNDLLGHAASVTYSGNGPATGNIYIRGLGAAGTGNQQQATLGSFPNVALYLDDQAMQFPARNNDVYMVDLERVEILEGPQGTLFGGGAQAGAVRYITRKPRLDATGGEVNAGYGTTAGGANDSALSAVLNLALIADRLALRAAIFSERQGGYISNVPSTISYAPGTPDATTGASANNSHLVASDTNPVTYQGLRLSLLWQIDENWSALLQQNYQSMDAEGYFYAYPFDSNGTALGPYQIAAFAPAYSRDRYESTAWTVSGRIGSLSAIYTGSFLDRHVDSQQDYSNYLRSATSSYYSCIGPGAKYFNDTTFPSLAGKPLTCYPPVANWHDMIDNQHQSHETAHQHRSAATPARPLRRLLGEVRRLRPDGLQLPAHSAVRPCQSRRGTGWRTCVSLGCRTLAGRVRERSGSARGHEHGLRQRRPARLPAARLLRLRGLRSHRQSADADCRHPPLSLR
jgi:outer membrane receptor protein involved in Fe transport